MGKHLREGPMKAVLICGSPRKQGNTEILLDHARKKLEERGVSSELILLAEHEVKPCVACRKCKELKDGTCTMKDDDFHPLFQKMREADAIIVGSPVYFGCATSQTTSLLHRAGYVSRANGNFFKGKIGAPIVVARRAGQNFTYAQLLFFFTINDMIVPGSTYWNVAFGRNKGEVIDDEEGMETISHFADNVADLLSR
jgi:multimeric flavodoxin WrbA